jgi:hypothetical protein
MKMYEKVRQARGNHSIRRKIDLRVPNKAIVLLIKGKVACWQYGDILANNKLQEKNGVYSKSFNPIY